MADKNIIISLSVDAQNAAEQVREFVAQSKASIEQTFVTATEKAAKAIYDLTSKQERLSAVITESTKKMDGLRQASEKAAGTDKALIDAEIAALEKLNASHQQEKINIEQKVLLLKAKGAAAAASTDAEKLAIQIVNQNRMIENAILKDNQKALESVAKAQTANAMAADKATAKRITDMENLNRQEQEHLAIMNKEVAQLADLQSRRASASGEDLKELDLESDAMKKIIVNHQQEIYAIQLKKLALEEEAQLSQAISEKEREAIKASIDARRVEIGTIKDTAKAQSSMTESVDESSSALAGLARQFMGALGWGTGIGAVVQVFRELDAIIVQNREDMEKAEEAAQKFRDLGGSIFDKGKTLFNEMGINDPAEQQAGMATISTISKATGVKPSQIMSTGASLAPILKQQGITSISDPRFADIVGQASILADKGISNQNLQDVVNLNPGATGQQLNQRISDLAKNTGSFAMANSFIDSYEQSKAIAQGAGFDSEAAEKLFVQLRNKGVSPREIPELMRQYMTSASRLRGLSQGASGELEADRNKFAEMPGMGGIAQIFSKSLQSGKPIDIPSFTAAIAKLPQGQQDEIDRLLGGTRGVTALTTGAGFEGVQLSSGALTPAQTNPDALSESEKEQADIDAPKGNRVGGSYLNQARTDEQAAMAKRSDLYTTMWKKTTFGDEETWADANVQGNLLIKLAQLREDIGNGKVKATPEQAASVDKYLSILGHGVGSDDQIQALISGGSGKVTRASVLGGINDQEKFLRDHLDYGSYATPSQGTEKNLQDAQMLQQNLRQQPTPVHAQQGAPSTQPVSVNYHQRIVNYGYGFDSIGGKENYGNNLG